jgi:ATP-dependent DNA helicase RecG
MVSSIEKLIKFAKLEIDRGYDNRSVFGGLNYIAPLWDEEAKSQKVDISIVESITEKLAAYDSMGMDQRKATIQEIITTLLAAGGKSPEGGPVSRTEENNKPAQSPQPPVQRAPQPTQSPVRNAQSQQPVSKSSSPIKGVELSAPLTVLSGIGSKKSALLKKLGVQTIGDMLFFFPRRYDDYSKLKPINRLEYGEKVTVLGTVMSESTRSTKSGKTITELVISDTTSFLRVNFFNNPYAAAKYKEGDQVVLAGKIDTYLGRLVMNHPDIELIDQQHLHTNRIVPIYPLVEGIGQKDLRAQIAKVVERYAGQVSDPLPEFIRKSAELPPIRQALQQIHYPDNEQQLLISRRRFAFEEIFYIQLGVLGQKRAWKSTSAQSYQVADDWIQGQIQRIPFQLTGAQRRVLDEIRADLVSGSPMNRLLQGDVGSGKTIIAALAIAILAQNGAQSALMAPTSILAEQHYRNLTRSLSEAVNEADIPPFQPSEIRLLVGDTPESERQEIRAGLANGEVKLLVGTHALIEDNVEFQRLQLAVIDEQHRFGVNQRARLRAKGENPHLLVMTATPIPRSMALTVYGDLDLSIMDEMPEGRQPVKTYLLSERERERVYTLIQSQIDQGHQAFIICPLVDQPDEDLPDLDLERKAAVQEHERLQSSVFPHLKLGLLHGRMKPEEKDRVMRQFREKEFHVLVSTSVVEVGVDIPNATVIMIEGANRFGLAQLHQFRGRVGRGGDESYCLLIPDKEDAIENERLLVMTETNDGFVLAERDLEQRGPGQFLGTRQSGFSELKMASLSDVHLIEKARQLAHQLFDRDPDLREPENMELSRRLEDFWKEGKGDQS